MRPFFENFLQDSDMENVHNLWSINQASKPKIEIGQHDKFQGSRDWDSRRTNGLRKPEHQKPDLKFYGEHPRIPDYQIFLGMVEYADQT